MTKNKDDICVIIQARLSSERVPNKMLKPFADTTLLDIALQKIVKLNSINPSTAFYLSAYEEELKERALYYGLPIFHRSKKSAHSEGTPLSDMYEWWNQLKEFKYCVLVNACAPFLKSSTIDNFIEDYSRTDSDGLFGVMKKKNYFWNKKGKLITPWPNGEACMNSKVVEPTYEAAHCLYGGRLDTIGEGIWMGNFQTPGEIELFEMEEEECLDVDYQWQFDMCENIYKQREIST